MSLFLSFVITGLVTGSVYALIATGLVVTYTTTGVFNFGHGAVAMASAFMFWQLWQGWHINVVVSVILMLVVIAPLFGLIVERVLMRPLRGQSVDVNVVVTLGLLLALVGAANLFWKPDVARSLPQFFGGRGFHAFGLLISYHQVIAIASLVVAGVGLRLLFTRARLGVAMRAVVDNSDLLAMAGGRPERVQQLAWALSCSLAALAGMLLAPLQQLNILNLTLLVVDGYAAAIIGRLRNLPVAIGGALAIAVGQDLALGYLPSSGFVSQIQEILPIIILFLALIVLPQDRLRTATLGGAIAPRVASLRSSIIAGTAVIAVAVLLSRSLSDNHLQTGTTACALALVLLSLMLVTGYGGMVSLCQMAFVGLGAYAMSHVGGTGGSFLGVIAAVGLAAAVGALVALPTLRLRGLYLALATFAFASVMEAAVFGQIFGSGGSASVAKVDLPGLHTQTPRGFFILAAVVFVLSAIGVLALRRGSFGRKLVATNDSPAACATLGVSVNSTKLITFTVAAGLAGLAGVIYGGNQGQVGTNDFAALLSLVVLLLARVGGINTATGALLGAITYSLYPILDTHYPKIGAAQYLLTGLAAISVGRDPNGLGGRIAQIAEDFRAGQQTRHNVVPPASPGTPAAVFLAEEGEGIVSAAH
jgi:branched-chain amino acid transport system permease protein